MFDLLRAGVFTLLVLVAGLAAAHAEESPGQIAVEVPVLIYEEAGGDTSTEEASQDLDQMVLSAAKRIQTVQESPSIVTVVTRNQIEARGYQGLGDVLDEIPGFEGNRPTYYFDSTDVLARGNARTVLVLWNGVSLNSPQSNRRQLGAYLPIDAVDRVEVVSGPGGTLWGANAFLGIMSVTTRRNGSGTSSELSMGVGLDGYGEPRYRGSATVSDSWWDGQVALYANLGLVSARGPVVAPPYDVTIGPFPAPDSDGTFVLASSTGATSAARDLWLPLTLAVDAGHFHLDVLYPLVARDYREFNDVGARTDHFQGVDGMLVGGGSSQRKENVSVASLRYERTIGARGGLTARAYYTTFEDSWAPLIKEPAGLIGKEAILVTDLYPGENGWLHDAAYRAGSTVDVSLSHGRASHLVVGSEVYLEGVREHRRVVTGGLENAEFVMAYAARRLVTAAFAEESFPLGSKVGLDLGARTQYAPGSYAPLVLGSAAAHYTPSRQVVFKLNVAQGFRPPAFELTNGNEDAISNPYPHRETDPALRAERSLSVEAEASAMLLTGTGRIRYLALRGGYQYTRLDDLIVFAADGAPVNSNGRIMGSVELRADLEITGGHRVVLGYGFVTGEDLETGPLRNIPQSRLSAVTEVRLARHVDAHLGVLATGAAQDLNRLPTVTGDRRGAASPSQVVVDRLPPSALVTAGVRASGLADGHVEVSLHVSNAFDSRAPVGDINFDRREAFLPMAAPGMSAFAYLTWRM